MREKQPLTNGRKVAGVKRVLKTYPKEKQRKVFEKVMKEGKSVSVAMREVGYSHQTAVTPHKVTSSKGWQQLLEENLCDKKILERHNELFGLKRIDYFVFPKQMEDQEIIEHVASVGIKVITVRESDKGKMAFYSITDGQAVSKALDMAYKIKGRYKDEEKGTHNNFDVKQIIIIAPDGKPDAYNQAAAEAIRSLPGAQG